MKVAYLTSHPFTRLTASTIRIAGMASALSGAGHDVRIVSSSTQGQSDTSLARLLAPGVNVVSLGCFPTSRVGVLKQLILGVDQMADWCGANPCDVYIGYGTESGTTRQLRRVGGGNALTCLDIVEWYQFAHRLQPRQLPTAVEHEISMRRSFGWLGGAFGISTRLVDYMHSKGVPSLRVPPLFPASIRTHVHKFREKDGRIHIAVAGTVGGKEALTLRNVIIAAESLNQMAEMVRVHVVGPSEAELRSVPGLGSRSLRHVHIYGAMSHERATAIVEASNFVAVQRPAGKKYAAAGFPSKVAESWVLGTPVIMNLSSDLGLYAQDGKNSVVLRSDGLDEMVRGLRVAVQTVDEFSSEAISAWASQEFSPTAFSAPMDQFLQAIC